MNTKLGLLMALCVPLALAGCGPQPARAASHAATARPAPPTPAPSPPLLFASPSPDPTTPPAPPGPLVVVASPNGRVAAVTADGAYVWAFDPAMLGIANPLLVTGGPNLLAYGGGTVAVIDRTGTVIGHGPYARGVSSVFPAPTGTRWAWTAVDSPPGSESQVNSLWVAGVGLAPRRVRTWTGAYEVAARQWSDAGIVIAKLNTACGRIPLSSTLVDPATGAETALFGTGRWPLDVGSGLRVATGLDLGTLYVEGTIQVTRTYPLPIQGASIAPSGGRVFVSTFGELGCGGTVRAATSVIEAPAATQTTIDGFFADAWLDDTHLLGRSPVTHPAGGFDWSARVEVADLAGRTSDLVLGRLVGVLRPPPS